MKLGFCRTCRNHHHESKDTILYPTVKYVLYLKSDEIYPKYVWILCLYHIFNILYIFMSSLCGVYVCVCVSDFSDETTRPRDMLFLCQLTCQSADIMSSLCGVGVRVRVHVNNFFSKTTRPRDMLFFLKDTLSIEDEKLFKACKSVCSSVC